MSFLQWIMFPDKKGHDSLPFLYKLLCTLKSQDVTRRQLESFCSSFDETFLGLSSSFVDDFNAQLKPKEKIVPNRPGCFSTDLRIVALIRLGGVKENELICSF